jgi:hypothetical protein
MKTASIFFVLAAPLLVAHSQASAQCAYSAYVDFGPAMTNGQLNKNEDVYRSSGLRRSVRSKDAAKNFRAVYTSYGQTKAGNFEIINIGPYDTEAVAFTELNSVLNDLRS